jgi:hypothetical protein
MPTLVQEIKTVISWITFEITSLEKIRNRGQRSQHHNRNQTSFVWAELPDELPDLINKTCRPHGPSALKLFDKKKNANARSLFV